MDGEVAEWRRQRRATLLTVRQTMQSDARRCSADIVAAKLDDFVASGHYTTIGLFWPIKHEINLLPWADAFARRHSAVLCLPVVVERTAPLEYWHWRQGEALDLGIWDIPIPARRDVVIPDPILAPMVAFDQANYRLGYGGGYFDRTLAAFARRPMVIGTGHDFGAQDTIFPQPRDTPMDAVVTERRDTPPPIKRNHEN